MDSERDAHCRRNVGPSRRHAASLCCGCRLLRSCHSCSNGFRAIRARWVQHVHLEDKVILSWTVSLFKTRNLVFELLNLFRDFSKSGKKISFMKHTPYRWEWLAPFSPESGASHSFYGKRTNRAVDSLGRLGELRCGGHASVAFLDDLDELGGKDGCLQRARLHYVGQMSVVDLRLQQMLTYQHLREPFFYICLIDLLPAVSVIKWVTHSGNIELELFLLNHMLLTLSKFEKKFTSDSPVMMRSELSFYSTLLYFLDPSPITQKNILSKGCRPMMIYAVREWTYRITADGRRGLTSMAYTLYLCSIRLLTMMEVILRVSSAGGIIEEQRIRHNCRKSSRSFFVHSRSTAVPPETVAEVHIL